MSVYDVVVVGAGIIGTCAAYHARKRGLNTLLIEQFSLGHGDGSSSGKSRIIRYAHTEPEYLPIVHESYKQIEELEKKRGEELWKRCGLLWMGKAEEIDDLAKILSGFNCKYDKLTAKQVTERYPQFHYDDKWKGLVDPMGGTILADKWLKAFQDEYCRMGGQVLEHTKVLSYVDDGTVQLTTSKGKIRAEKAIFAPGTWIAQLVPDVPFKHESQLISVMYWKPKRKEDAKLLAPEHYPTVIINIDGIGYYSLPSVDYDGAVKFAYHEGDKYDVGNELVDLSKKFIDGTQQHIRDFVPVLDSSAPVRIDRCKYAMSPDEHYVIDYHPRCKNIVICGCMSGTGFKVGPALGVVLNEMVHGEKPSIDVSFFSLKRFHSKL